MAGKKFTEMSNEELLKIEKSLKVLTYMLLTSCIVLCITGAILTLKKGFNPMFVVALGLIPIVIVNGNSLKQIKKEKEQRAIK